MTRSDAHSAGLTDGQLRRRVDAGQLLRRSPQVYVVGGAPSTPLQRLLVATLALDAAACDASASWLHGLRDSHPRTPHVARRERAGARPEGVVLHRRQDLSPSDLVRVEGIRTTNPTRTVLDLAAHVDDKELRRIIGRATKEGLTHRDRLIGRYLTMARSGRLGIARAGRVLRGLDADLALLESDLEHRLLELITCHGLPQPVAQFRVEVGAKRYRIDFAYPVQRVAIEGDGFEFHSDQLTFEEDRSRQNELVLSGWRILRFTWRQICTQPDHVADQIRAALDSPSG